MSVGGVSTGAYAEPTPVAPSVPTLVWLAAGNSGLFKRENGVWSEVTLPAELAGMSRIAAVDGLPDVLFISDGEDQAVTEDGGDTWTVSEPFVVDRSVHDIAIGPDADTLYVAQFSSGDPSEPDQFNESPGRIWRSLDKGSTWSLLIPGNQAASGFYGEMLPRLEWSSQGGFSPVIYLTDLDQNGPDNVELHCFDVDGLFDFHVDIGAGETTDMMLNKIRGQVSVWWDVLYTWTRVFPVTGDFGIWRWSFDLIDNVTPPGYVTAGAPSVKAWVGCQGHVDGTVLAFFWTNNGSTIDILRSEDLGDTWELAGQFSTSSGGSDPAFRATNSITLRQNSTPNPGDSNEWWALSAKANQVLHSTDKGNTWTPETVTGLTAGHGDQIIAVPI